MKLVILAGGKGTRLGLSNVPKPMVKIGEKPLLQHQIELAKRYGVRDIFILSGHLSGAIFDYFKDGTDFGVKIVHIVEPYPLGTAGSVKLLEHIIKEERFLLFYGDIMMDIDISALLEFDKRHKAIATLVVHPNDHPYDSDLVEMGDENSIICFHSKPHNQSEYYSNLVNAAVYILSKEIFAHIPFGIPMDFGKDLFPKLLKSGQRIVGYKSTEYIKDVGTKDRLKEVTKDFLNGRIRRLNKENRRKAIFLDRDGVINEEVNLLHKVEDFKLLDGVGEAIKKINHSEFLAVVITNQPVVAKNLCSIDELKLIHKKMETLLGREGAYLDGIYFCPHHPEKGFPEENVAFKIECDCRKPKTGLIKQAQKELNIALEGSYFIGDTERDIRCGKAAGLTTIGLMTGYGCKNSTVKPDYLFDNLLSAVKFVLDDPYSQYFSTIRKDFYNKKIKPYIVLIGGNSRSGKTVLSKYLEQRFEKEHLNSCCISLDNWLVPYEKRTSDMNVFDRFNTSKITEDFKNMMEGEKVKLKCYEPIKRGEGVDEVIYSINGYDVIIIEGVVALSINFLREVASIKIFCDIDDALLIKRLKSFYAWKGLTAEEIEKIIKIRKLDEYNLINEYKKRADLVVEAL